ncbi:hypothetical protein [Sphaerimonospora thailandensis]|uniref:WD40 repeat protein n=1 Tax=Sphaerimonospora thailandensis TaxID=795644 RepID=A0A8J3R6S8_9ACTN|nr:hypothetical protein [Sphaerimonospora thailandensis]GIH69029.1 hypothetical protein Mth01_12820 [Sphaerimonospora thailandensis]
MKKPALLTLAAAAASVASVALVGGTQAQALTVSASATSVTASAARNTLASSTASAARTATASADKRIRYVWVKQCGKGDATVPCGPWTVTLTNGKDVRLTDALVFSLTAKGKVDKGAMAPLTVSGDGNRIAYFRKPDGKLVVRDVAKGRVHMLPGSSAKPPKGLTMTDVALTLSPNGEIIMIDYGDSKGKLPSLLVDLRSKKIGKLKGNLTFEGFSPDGKHVLTRRVTSENTTEFAAYDLNGNRTNSQVVPQVVANNSPIALADDGTSMALIINVSDTKKRLRTYDLASDTVGDYVNVTAPKDEYPYSLRWTPEGGLTLWALRYDREMNLRGVTLRGLDPATGATIKIDSFKLRSDLWNWYLPG